MPTRSELLAHGQAISFDPRRTELATLHVSRYASIRITAATQRSAEQRWVPASRVMSAITPQPKEIDQLDGYQLNPATMMTSAASPASTG
jgi:hypothetical protein